MELLKRFKEGDIDAFETLFRQSQAEVYGWIVQIVRDRGIAEDLTIEAFWRIYKAQARFDTDAAFGAWASRIASNLAIDHVRARRTEQRLPEQLPTAEAPDSSVRREMGQAIKNAFRWLPPKLQVAATLALIEERSYEEIAMALGKPVGTIRTRVFQAAACRPQSDQSEDARAGPGQLRSPNWQTGKVAPEMTTYSQVSGYVIENNALPDT